MISAHPIPTDLETAKALSASPAALDLFTWLSYRCFTARGRREFHFGEFGLVSQHGGSDYAEASQVPREIGGMAQTHSGDVA